jgi:hypothetical protein
VIEKSREGIAVLSPQKKGTDVKEKDFMTIYDQGKQVRQAWYHGAKFIQNSPNARDIFQEACSILGEDAVRNRGTVYTLNDDAMYSCLAGTNTKVKEHVRSKAGSWLAFSEFDDECELDVRWEAYVWNDGLAIVYPRERTMIDLLEEDEDDDGPDDENVVLYFVTRNLKDVEDIRRILVENKAPPRPYVHKNPGTAYVLANIPMRGTKIMPLGLAGEKLIRDNYEEDVLEGYDAIVEDIKRINPFGRLTILEGIPGGGKTHMVQSLMLDCPDSKFVVVPPQLMKSLTDPGLILSIMDDASITAEGAPLVFVLEDSDQCLTERNSENMSDISAILNLSDGIIGKLMNIRLVATLNSTIEGTSFDTAALRDGRLTRHVKIGRLSPERANKAWSRIVNRKGWSSQFSEPVTLAQVYKSAKIFLDGNPEPTVSEELEELKRP